MLCANPAAARFGVLGPAPAPLGRLSGEHRAQLFLKGRNAHAMREALHGRARRAAGAEAARRSWTWTRSSVL